ncbi:MAG: exonuclease SbcCD subunit D [Chloroflexota bacterium]|nr:exonuclease SbcCD subunit D [Chloroflexota bacterium]
MKFVHAADVHLGYRQYNHPERFKDFGVAFQKIVDCTVEEQAKVCLIAGDLFHKSSIDPSTLIQAEDELQRLKEYNIKTIAISGNHDRPRYGQAKTWLDYLASRELLVLLETTQEGKFVVEGQSYVDLEGVRFIGMPWYGGSTRLVLESIADELPQLSWDNVRYSVLMAHTGIEGQMLDMPDMLRFEDVNPLREYIHYLALGHLHKPYQAPTDTPWIYNPGAIENSNFDEARFDSKGVFIVTIGNDGTSKVRKKVIKGRPFRTIEFSITKSGNFDTLVHQLRQALEVEKDRWRDPHPPVVNLLLTGNLKFDRSRLNIEGLRQLAQDCLECLLVRINTRLDNLEIIGDYDDELTAEQLECQVFADIAREGGYSDRSEKWGQFLRGIKQKALSNEKPENIHQTLSEFLADDTKVDE